MTGQERRRQRIEAELVKIREAVSRLRPEKVVLFGSCARGDFHEGSDIDLLVVMETQERFLDRIGRVQEVLDCALPVEAVVYTPAEFQRMLAEGNSFVTRAMAEGRVLYERPKP
jgi:predicted nucleotidyltransferase